MVSGSLARAIATTNWCLGLILTWPLLAFLKPKPTQRQSSKAFDVGPAFPDQSPSFHAVGIGGQLVGFRATCIIADDVETQTNSLTTTMREKIREAVKEFESVLKPRALLEDGTPDPASSPPVIRYLGTPHDEDSLYNYLMRTEGGKPSAYVCRIWPARYPTAVQVKKYGKKLAPYIPHMMRKLGPGYVGKSTMPSRFPDSDLATRELAIGKSEFALQFMLDTSLSDRDKYPLKLADLMVLALDPRRAPDVVSWSNDPAHRLVDVPSMGFDGDYFHRAVVPDGVQYSPYSKIVAFIDSSGRGADETAMAVVGELHGILYVLGMEAHRDGFSPETLKALAATCVRFEVHEVHIEENFGGGMFLSLFQPVLEKAWASENSGRKAQGRASGGTKIVGYRAASTMSKERRILSVMEPAVQSHRLVLARSLIEWDIASLDEIDSEDTRHTYSLIHQFTRLTREKDSLLHDDRLDALAGAVGTFGSLIGVDPSVMAQRAEGDRIAAELERLLEGEEALGLDHPENTGADRARHFKPEKR